MVDENYYLLYENMAGFLLNLLMEINDRFRKLQIYQSYKNEFQYKLFFHNIAIYQYTSHIATPNMNISHQPAAAQLMIDIKHH